MSYASDQKRSLEAFRSVVWQQIAPLIGGGEFITIEGSANQTDRDLDMSAGIDGYQKIPGRGLRGIATRVQWISEGSKIAHEIEKTKYTFTVRLRRDSGVPTEYKKRRDAIGSEFGEMLPDLTIQAYLSANDNKFLAAAAVRTKDLYGHLEMCLERHKKWAPHRTAGPLSRCYTNEVKHDGAATFLVVPWGHLIDSNVELKTTEPKIPRPAQPAAPAPHHRTQVSLFADLDEPCGQCGKTTPDMFRVGDLRVVGGLRMCATCWRGGHPTGPSK